MNLGTLLAAGKSVALGRNGDSPFHADRNVYLPKFVSPKNPFVAVATKTVEPVVKQMAPVPVKKEIVIPVPAQRALATPFAKPVERPPLPGSHGMARKLTWVNKLNPFGGGHAPSQAVAKGDKVATQTEMSLDTVKVLRNDLTDVDVEVVPLKSRPPGEAAVSALGQAKKPWEFIGERLFKMETT
jgi:hypothetical protein